MGTDGVFFTRKFFETTIRMLGGLLSAYHLSGGRIVVHGVQKEVATYKGQILMFTWTLQKILENA
jgi:hypothetical protein